MRTSCRFLNTVQAALAVLTLLAAAGASGVAAQGRAAPPAPAAEAPSAEVRAAVRRVVERQLLAFQRDDGEEAFSYAAPDIQARFGTPENFMRMVRGGYRAVYRPLQVSFQAAVLREGRLVQPLLVTGEDGRGQLALYLMERQPDGSWRIGGVTLLPTGGTGA